MPMSLHLDRHTSELSEAFRAGQLSRRSFITRLLALGLTPAAAGAILAVSSSQLSALALQSDVSGEMRFMIGPWTDKETEHQETIAAAFNQLYPNVKFSFKLFDWGTSGPEVDASLTEGSHDIYYFLLRRGRPPPQRGGGERVRGSHRSYQ